MHHLPALRSITPVSSFLPFALVLISLQGGRRVEGVHMWSSAPEDNSCRDVYRRCHIYKENNECQNSRRTEWMKTNCARSCGFCVPRTPACKESQYGCCEDRLTPADGPNREGCSMKLCVDQIVCDKLKDACDSESKVVKKYMKEKCAATCGFCRAPASAMKKCEEQKPMYGCCWNGDPATGPGSQGCPVCMDTSRHVCKLFQDKCTSKFFIEQSFMERHCPRTCGRCSHDCFDFNAKCGQWTLDGLCKRQIWAHFMKKHCAKSCGYCRGVAVEH